MNDKYGKYQYRYSNVNPVNNNVKTKYLVSGVNNNNIKKTNYANKNYLTKTEITQKSKNIISNHIKIDLSKYNNNNQKEKSKDVILNKKTMDNNFKHNKSESRSRYVNRSERKLNESNNSKITYKKVYIDLNKEKKANNYSSNALKIPAKNKIYQSNNLIFH